MIITSTITDTYNRQTITFEPTDPFYLWEYVNIESKCPLIFSRGGRIIPNSRKISQDSTGRRFFNGKGLLSWQFGRQTVKYRRVRESTFEVLESSINLDIPPNPRRRNGELKKEKCAQLDFEKSGSTPKQEDTHSRVVRPPIWSAQEIISDEHLVEIGETVDKLNSLLAPIPHWEIVIDGQKRLSGGTLGIDILRIRKLPRSIRIVEK